MSNAAFKAVYANFKPIASRNVMQVILEVPMEQGEQVLNILGMPNQQESKWVGVARLENGQTAETASLGQAAPVKKPTPSPAPSKHFNELPYPNRAGILASTGDFWIFIGVETTEAAAEYIRQYCGVTSRALIVEGSDSAKAFDVLYNSFDHWKKYERSAA